MPPIRNLTAPDPAADLDLVTGAARTVTTGAALTNAFGFGGHNASLVFTPA